MSFATPIQHEGKAVSYGKMIEHSSVDNFVVRVGLIHRGSVRQQFAYK